MDYQCFEDISQDLLKKVEKYEEKGLGLSEEMQWQKIRERSHETALHLYQKVREISPRLFYAGQEFNREILGYCTNIFYRACLLGGKDPVEVLRETFKMSGEKNQDYSPINIIIYGQLGVLIRMTDKAVRLWNLASRSGEDLKVKDESVIATAMDMINYSIYLQMLGQGRWLANREQQLQFLDFLLGSGKSPQQFGAFSLYGYYFARPGARMS